MTQRHKDKKTEDTKTEDGRHEDGRHADGGHKDQKHDYCSTAGLLTVGKCILSNAVY